MTTGMTTIWRDVGSGFLLMEIKTLFWSVYLNTWTEKVLCSFFEERMIQRTINTWQVRSNMDQVMWRMTVSLDTSLSGNEATLQIVISAILIDTSFLNLSFVNTPFTLAKGDTFGVEIRRSSSDNKFQIVSIRTIYRNAEDACILNPITWVVPLWQNCNWGIDWNNGSGVMKEVFSFGQHNFLGISDYELLIYEGQFFGPQDQSIPAWHFGETIFEVCLQVSWDDCMQQSSFFRAQVRGSHQLGLILIPCLCLDLYAWRGHQIIFCNEMNETNIFFK